MFVRIFVSITIISMLSGCSVVWKTKDTIAVKTTGWINPSVQDLSKIAPDKCRVVSGKVDGGNEKLYRLVIAVSDRYKKGEIADCQLVYPTSSKYAVFLPEGSYHIYVFADIDHDGKFSSTEMVVVPEKGHELNIDLKECPDKSVRGINLKIDTEHPHKYEFPEKFIPPEASRQVVSLDDPVFSSMTVSLGLAKPLSFYRRIPSYVYWLEPFDKDKIPVVFVHGYGCSPRKWKEFIKDLDRTRYQPCFFYYATGADLDYTAGIFAKLFFSGDIGTKNLIITAHSMGGLVVRSALNRVHSKYLDYILFISLASPYGGSKGARLGVKQSPVLIDSWRDLAAGSKFLNSLFAEPLPGNTTFHLMFSYRSGPGIGFGANSDGAVTIASQLPIAAQCQAEHVFGFDANHGGILTSKEVFEVYEKLIDEFADKTD